MRGIFLQQPLEFRLEVPGDTFVQGSTVSCTLSIKNHGDSAVRLDNLTLQIALGNVKKVKAKDESAFEQIQAARLEQEGELEAKGSRSIPYTFSLDANFPIADKQQGPYLLYGNAPSSSGLGQLPLTVTPHPHLRVIFDTFTTVFSFINKGESFKSGWTSVKLKPPESRRMSFVDELNLSARFNENAIELKYLFTVKKFDTSLTKLDVKKGKAEVVQTLDPAQYLFGGGFVRQEYIEQMIDAGLAEVSSGI